MGTYFIALSKNSQFYWYLKSTNNETICVSETYTTKQAALAGIEAFKRLSPNDENYHFFTGANGQYYFNLKGKNGERVAQSEGYQTKQGALNGIASCKVHGPTSPVKEPA